MKEETKKINFFTRIYLAIFKIKEYNKLLGDGIKKSTKFIKNVILIFAIIYASIVIAYNKIEIDKLKKCLNEKLPELTYKDGILESNSEKTVILDDDIIKANFGGIMVVDTTREYEDILDEFREEKQPVILLTKDKCITMKDDKINYYTYEQVITRYFQKDTTNIDKQEIINSLQKVNYIYYFIVAVITYYVVNLLVIYIYDLILSSITYIILKIKKKNLKFLDIFSISIYASTLLTIGFLTAVFLSKRPSAILQIILAVITIIYLVKALKVVISNANNE